MNLLRLAAGRGLDAATVSASLARSLHSLPPHHIVSQRRARSGTPHDSAAAERRQNAFGETAEESASWADENARRVLSKDDTPVEEKTDAKGLVEEVEDHMLRVAVFGKQGVGKTRLFNALVDKPDHGLYNAINGATSDCRIAEATLGRMFFTAIDTPGITDNVISPQCRMIVHSVDVALFVVNARDRVDKDDMAVSEFLAKHDVPVVVLANKADTEEITLSDRNQRQLLQHGLALNVSAKAKLGFGALQDMLAPYHALREADRKEEEWALEDAIIAGDVSARDALGNLRRVDRPIKVCITGTFNVGKSTLVNSLLGYDRSSVTNLPGTTRDRLSVHTRFRGQLVEFVDCPGVTMRQKSSWLLGDPRSKDHPIREDITYWMHNRSMDAAIASHVIVYVFDARFGLSKADIKKVTYLASFGRPIVLVANKWDQVEDKRDLAQQIQDQCTSKHETKTMTVVCTSAKNGTNLGLLMESVLDHYRRWHVRLAKGKLNVFWRKMTATIHIPRMSSKARHIQQVASCPPTFVIFLSKSQILDGHIAKYMINIIRKEFYLDGIPIRLIQRRRPPSVFRQLGYTQPEKIYKRPGATLTRAYETWSKGATSPGSLEAAGAGRTKLYKNSGAITVPSHLLYSSNQI